MLIGYARISTEDQKLDLQHDALRATGCEKIFDETASGASNRLPVRAVPPPVWFRQVCRPGDRAKPLIFR